MRKRSEFAGFADSVAVFGPQTDKCPQIAISSPGIEGKPVINGCWQFVEIDWHLQRTEKRIDWLTGDMNQRTITWKNRLIKYGELRPGALSWLVWYFKPLGHGSITQLWFLERNAIYCGVTHDEPVHMVHKFTASSQ